MTNVIGYLRCITQRPLVGPNPPDPAIFVDFLPTTNLCKAQSYERLSKKKARELQKSLFAFYETRNITSPVQHRLGVPTSALLNLGTSNL